MLSSPCRESINTAGNTDIEMDYAPKGVNPDIVRLISGKNEEPEWMTEWRLSAVRAAGSKMEEPTWAMVNYPKIDYQDQYYYARPKSMEVQAEVAGRGRSEAVGDL